MMGHDAAVASSIDAVFAAHPELHDHRSAYPWLTGWLGNPDAPVWFIGEKTSLAGLESLPPERIRRRGPEAQWDPSFPGDRVLREGLIAAGLHDGPLETLGGWRCYLTNVVKGAERVGSRKKRSQADRDAEARLWAPVLRTQMEYGQPRLFVCLGSIAARMLDAAAPSLPPLPPRDQIYHYSYIGNRPERSTGLPRMHPARIAAYEADIARCAARLADDADADVHLALTTLAREPGA
jgi:hypothetical protein